MCRLQVVGSVVRGCGLCTTHLTLRVTIECLRPQAACSCFSNAGRPDSWAVTHLDRPKAMSEKSGRTGTPVRGAVPQGEFRILPVSSRLRGIMPHGTASDTLSKEPYGFMCAAILPGQAAANSERKSCSTARLRAKPGKPKTAQLPAKTLRKLRCSLPYRAIKCSHL